MFKSNIYFIIKSSLFLALFVFSNHIALASISSGTVDATNKYTRICKDETCSTFGNINMKPTININTPGAAAISITDAGITGHAWGDEIGWINMNPTGAGVTINPSTGLLSGRAYANTGGWINFAVTGQSVTLVDNGAGSNFYGWAYVSGLNGGWIKFDCGSAATCIKTDWRSIPNRSTSTPPVITPTPSSGGGVLPSFALSNPSTIGNNLPTQVNSQSASSTPPKPPTLQPETIVSVEPSTPSQSPSYSGGVTSSNAQETNVAIGEPATDAAIKNVAGLNPENIRDAGVTYSQASTQPTPDFYVYKPAFSNEVYKPQTPCEFCVVLRKDSNVGDEAILKWKFIPVPAEIRIPASEINKVIGLVNVPDVDLTSSVLTAAGGAAAWRYVIYVIIRKLIIKI